ncbi:hypothetical protein B0H14DRAFT_2630848 [Mycena olivaceomarginata]|nr:hypothetical protein B0H14DRAFT_2630848 [Mycena olivaceomarginata]
MAFTATPCCKCGSHRVPPSLPESASKASLLASDTAAPSTARFAQITHSHIASVIMTIRMCPWISPIECLTAPGSRADRGHISLHFVIPEDAKVPWRRPLKDTQL